MRLSVNGKNLDSWQSNVCLNGAECLLVCLAKLVQFLELMDKLDDSKSLFCLHGEIANISARFDLFFDHNKSLLLDACTTPYLGLYEKSKS